MMPDDCRITGLTNGQPATFADYEALFQPCERPRKFSAHEVGFTVPPNGAVGYRCQDCRHYFVNALRDRRVCEIMRLKDEQPVPMLGACRFWNRAGLDYPLLRIL